MLAIVSFVLIGAMADSTDDGNADKGYKEANKILLSSLKNDQMGPEEVHKLLENHQDKEFKVEGITVDELAKLWLCSVEKCTPEEFQSSFDLQGNFNSSFPILSEYIKFCRLDRLPNYCLEHIDEVRENLMKISETGGGDKKLVRTFMKYYHKAEWPANGDFSLCVKEAYLNLFRSEYPDYALFTDQEKAFRGRVREALKPLEEFAGFLLERLDSRKEENGALLDHWRLFHVICQSFKEEVIRDLEQEKVEVNEEIEESEDQIRERLLSMLKTPRRSNGPEPKEVYKFLKHYPNREFKIDGITVDELAKLWVGSVKRCTPEEFQSLFYLQGNFYSSFPVLSEYIKFCRLERLPNYCLKHIDQAKENLLKILPKDEEDKRLVPSLVKYINEAEFSENNGNFDIIVKEAYEKLFRSEYPDGALFTQEEKEFRDRVEEALEPLEEFARFFLRNLDRPKVNDEPLLYHWGQFHEICRSFEDHVVRALEHEEKETKKGEGGEEMETDQIHAAGEARDSDQTNRQANETLLSTLKSESLKPKEVYKLLKYHPDRKFELQGTDCNLREKITVEEAAKLWVVSIEMFNQPELEHLWYVKQSFSSSFPGLHHYFDFCTFERLQNYFSKHVDEVAGYLIKNLAYDGFNDDSLHDHELHLVPSLLRYVQEEEALDNKRDLIMIVKEAYVKLFHSERPNDALFTAEESGFREDVHRCIECFESLARFIRNFKCPELGEAQLDWEKIGAICGAFQEAIDHLDDGEEEEDEDEEDEEEEMEVESED